MERQQKKPECLASRTNRELYYWVTNDRNLGETTIKALESSKAYREQLQSESKKPAFFSIGYGATISLAPEIGECCLDIVVFDSNQRVLEHHAKLVEVIGVSSDVNEVYERMAGWLCVSAQNVEIIYRNEAQTFGRSLHWTNSERFRLIQEALRQISYTYVRGNFLEESGLRRILALDRISPVVFNVTNMHYNYWLRRHSGTVATLVEQVASLPEKSVVIYSHSEQVGQFPQAMFGSRDKYLEFLKTLAR